MSAKRVLGIVLILVGVAAFVWGGVFWTDRDTVIDAGPLEVSTEEREGIGIPPVLGAVALIGGIVLLVLPDRRRT
jgi:drug/metabolite transporter (DMT)-like permease